MSDKINFIPVKGTEEKILALPHRNGCVYFATDTHKIYLDTETKSKILMGGGGNSNSGIYYGSRKPLTDDSEDGIGIIFSGSDIEGDLYPSKDDLILNIPDGSFYRVISSSIETQKVVADRLTVAGNGGGASSSITKGALTVSNHNVETSILNGSSYDFTIKLTSPADKEEGTIYTEKDSMYVTISYYKGFGEEMSKEPYFTEQKRLTHDIPFEYSAGPNLRDSQDTTITFKPGIIGYTGNLSDMFGYSSLQITKAVTCTNLTLEWLETSFNNNDKFEDKIEVSVNGSTITERIFDVYFDDLLIHTEILQNGIKPSSVTVTKDSLIYDEETFTSTGEKLNDSYCHGTHTIKAKLSLRNSAGKRGSSTDLITKEVAIYLEEKPLIWIGDLSDKYYEYDTIFVPYRVYDPNVTDGNVHVYLYKNGADVLDGGFATVSNNATTWTYWEISDLSVEENASYTLRVGTGQNEVRRNLTFNIEKDPRGMKPASGDIMNFYAKGHSNTQSNRTTLLINNKKAILSDFNWYNNGWITENNQTSLKISNGASVKLPIGPLTFGAADSNAHTIEFKMKVSNIQDYSTLVTNYTRYKYEDDKAGISWNDDVKSETNPGGCGIFQKFLDQRLDGYSNYDAYLTKQLPIEKANHPDVFWPTYDDLQFDRLYRDYNLSNAIISYKADNADVSTDPAICFGPQDGFFTNGTDSVSVNFVENKIINVAIVCNGGTTMTGNDNLMKIYINGMLTSLARSTKSKDGNENATWTIGNDPTKAETYLVFDSNVCDIDLYALRIYNKALNVSEILHNYAYDNTDTLEWDLVEDLYEIVNNQYQFSFDKMIKYNESDDVKYGKKKTIMPYIVFTTDDEDDFGQGNLPWFKTESDSTGVSHYEKADMEFVNPALDLAYNRGFLGAEAKAEGYKDNISYKKEKDDSVFNPYQTYYNQNGEIQDNVTEANYVSGTYYLKSGTSAVEEYYLHHCPSWTATDISLGVQGTSSEFYPRRNYKAKTKTEVPVYKEGTDVQETVIHYLNNDESSPISYIEYKVDKSYRMTPNRGPFAAEYDKYERAEGALDPRSMKFFYYDNKIVGTNKFTLKIDFMESSGSYNMGLANLVNSAYSHHPLSDYNAANAFVEKDPEKSDYKPYTGEYEEGKTYYYVTHKGDIKAADGTAEAVLNITSAEDFALTPLELWHKNDSANDAKIFMTAEKKALLPEEVQAHKIKNVKDGEWVTTKFATPEAVSASYVNTWLEGTVGYKTTQISNVDSYRTSVQGFPTLAFHQTKKMKAEGKEPVFIGRYNMLLDKGADEAYGFKMDTMMNFVDKKTVEEVAECWEFENNNRGFCSFRDPWNRKELSFDAPDNVKRDNPTSAFTTNGAPIVADSFEYRYNVDSDYIDLLVHLNNSSSQNEPRVKLYEKFGFDVGDTNTGKDNGRKQLLDIYKNWEKAVAWVWSTATDAVIDIKNDGNPVEVPSLGTYTLNPNVGVAFESNKYYIRSYVQDGTEKDPDDENKLIPVFKEVYTKAETYVEFIENEDGEQEKVNYYQLNVVDGKDIYSVIKIANDSENVYAKNKFYIKVSSGAYMISEDDQMNQELEYYVLTDTTDSLDDAWKLPVDEEGNTIYAAWDSDHRYKYDTKEYRLAKFKNELTAHFNFEYLITYFTITEILECYDSRGKNCMMASWGPQKDGGEYIWYPIFYDLDTQLGINNTGIPSFEYDIDATEEGTFSTNDSVLWNNLYNIFKDSVSLKYQQLKGTAVADFKGPNTDTVGKLNNAPFTSVDKIEQYYSCNPNLYKSYSMQGERPLLAMNLDEQYKYITITDTDKNNLSHKVVGDDFIAIPPITAGFVGSNIGLPIWESDSSNTYFYALQGNRSMSRQQFLTNRINYIDSWLNVGNYARAGKNRIRSRVSANSSSNSSDKWIEGSALNGDTGLTPNVPYYDENGKKTHLFDGEYWITMTPARNMYVTVGTDAANFPSLKYKGTPVRFETADLENGVRKSGNYREQLYYIYGLDQMKSLGDLSRLYFQEFALEGKISKLTDLKLGYDGLDEEGNEYRNRGVNDWTIPGSAEDSNGGMPLLKEMNLSNITFRNTAKVVNLSSCTKLRNFRCTGSNITGVTFAEGVALDTLYLSDTITSLSLTEAKMLTELLEEYEHPEANEDGNLVAKKGLYIAGLTDATIGSNPTKITSININGGNLGYNSYKLLQKYYDSCKNYTTTRRINLTNVQWSQYVKVGADAERDETGTITYYVDNGHFGLREFDESVDTSWIELRNNGRLYIFDATMKNVVNITDTAMLSDLLNKECFKGLNGTSQPNITGIIYINNTIALDEGLIQTSLQKNYPNLTFFFNAVDTGYAAKFVIAEEREDGTIRERIIGTDKLSKTALEDHLFFKNPMERALTEDEFNNQTIDAIIANKDFLGWGTGNNKESLIETYDDKWLNYAPGNVSKKNWGTQQLIPGVYDYTFYAVFDYHYYPNYFHDENNVYTQLIKYGDPVYAPSVTEFIPTKSDANLSADKTYVLVGWATKEGSTNKVNLNNILSTEERHFYAIFEEKDVHEVVNYDLFTFTPYNYTEIRNYDWGGDSSYDLRGYKISPAPGVAL